MHRLALTPCPQIAVSTAIEQTGWVHEIAVVADAPVEGARSAQNAGDELGEKEKPGEPSARGAQNLSVDAAQRRAFELHAQGESLEAVLSVLVNAAEAHCSQQVIASILLVDADRKHLRHGAAPSLPDEYCKAIDGIEIGPSQGSCGTAAHFGRTVVVDDILDAPLWVNFKDLATKHNLRACWSTPILSLTDQRVLGTFALYHRTVAVPSRRDIETVSLLVGAAAQILDADRAKS